MIEYSYSFCCGVVPKQNVYLPGTTIPRSFIGQKMDGEAVGDVDVGQDMAWSIYRNSPAGIHPSYRHYHVPLMTVHYNKIVFSS